MSTHTPPTSAPPPINIREELDWIYSTLQNVPRVFLLESVVDAGKEYNTMDVHEWGALEGMGGIYGKIRDLVKVRIFEAVRDEILDKVLAGEILKTYYYAPFRDSGMEGGVVGRREVVVRFV